MYDVDRGLSLCDRLRRRHPAVMARNCVLLYMHSSRMMRCTRVSRMSFTFLMLNVPYAVLIVHLDACPPLRRPAPHERLPSKPVHSFIGHKGGVWSCASWAHLLVSGACDKAVKVWDLNSGTLLHTMEGHTHTVRCVKMQKNTAVSSSRDKTVRVWNALTGQLKPHRHRTCLHLPSGC